MSLDPVILAELLRGGPPMWVSGRAYPAGVEARSPANWQRYVRINAGAGATDPSIDDVNWLLWSKRIEDAVAVTNTAVGQVNTSVGNVSAAVTQLSGKVDAISRVWTAAASVAQGALVASPADKEIYRRAAATGTSATDPADDTTNYFAHSYQRTTSLPTGYLVPTNYPDQVRGITKTAQTNIAQATRMQVLSVTGRGQLLHIGNFRSVSGTGGSRMEIWVDGRKVYEWEAVGAVNYYAAHLGSVYKVGDDVVVAPGTPVVFRRSLAVWLTPTYSPWVGTNDYVGHSFRTEA
ncbi:hypothetical protein [Paracidovorax konjaci]|uniref:Uncharacterized protein n=1 Tax=Paracidovorax konjaci TaxID=32040 RepID=A0A1I1XS02_9BURK|nr:hypothetical protein [Paracidovorax konjaci]SFE10019.1 hypothetical protein SAMN04489710_11477 [Paracidovorax konjaci]